MNLWIIAAIIVGLLVIAGITITALTIANEQETKTTSTCTGCKNSCTAEKNCGLATCGAVNGGKCGCGR